MFGAYKFPRELTWIVGVFLLLMTLGMAFTGQVMRFDQDAYWGLGIGASICGRVPFIGAWVVHLLLGGPIIAGDTLSRFFAFHVFVIPGLLIGFVSVHLLMVLKLGINEWPMPGRLVRRSTYVAGIPRADAQKDGVPFVPDAVWKDMFFSAFIIFCVLACAAFFGPYGPSGQPDPTIVQTVPKPDFFFQWLYALLAFLPPQMETPALLIGPVVIHRLSGVLPFFAGEGEKSWKRRPIAVVTILLRGSRARHLDPSCQLHSVEPDHERLERRSRAGSVSEWALAAGTPGRGGLPGEAMPQLPLHRRLRRNAWARASIAWPCA